MGISVGELQEQWQFPSDHLPIGMTFENVHFASWNVLNAKSMKWVTEKNTQGLSRSLIADEHVYIEDSELTVREQHVADLILQMIAHPTHPRSILSLQECSQPFVAELRARLPAHFEVISEGDNAILLDRRLFEVVSSETVSGIFLHAPTKTLQNVTMRYLPDQQHWRLVNAHVDGDPTKPSHIQFAQYLADTFDPTLPTFAMGDMNFNELEMADALKQAFPNDAPFSLHSPYCTNISPRVFQSKAIDHFLIYSPENVPISLSRPNEILPGLDATASLLNPPEYIYPHSAHHINAPLPLTYSSDQLVGIYGNILYPQDREQIQQKKLADWIEADASTPFPLSSEELNEISLYILDRFPLRTMRYFIAASLQESLAQGELLEVALEEAVQKARVRALAYEKIAQNVPKWEGRCEMLIAKLLECADQAEQIAEQDAKAIRKNPALAQQLLETTAPDLIQPPFSWETRTQVFQQMVDKTLSVSPNSPYFLALQEVTPQALSDLKKTLAGRNLQWISFNNLSGKETLEPQQEEILGEATAFTSTLALSPDLQVLKVDLGDLPTESGSVRKILGVRVQNQHTQEIFNLFTTHTDHKIQNNIYERTAAKIHAFATQFFQDASPSDQRFVFGGDLNAFDLLGGGEYVGKLRELFAGSQDFRETDYYAPPPIAWSSFIGRYDDTYAARLAQDGMVEPSALDHILVGNGIELQSASREAGVYNASGQLLDYYTNRDEYVANLQNRVTFSDHFFNIVRFKAAE
jgi:endonuclease/exonuclease/phosphatase family metal-dependent hydrolase